jgi:hypothetical protein
VTTEIIKNLETMELFGEDEINNTTLKSWPPKIIASSNTYFRPTST